MLDLAGPIEAGLDPLHGGVLRQAPCLILKAFDGAVQDPLVGRHDLEDAPDTDMKFLSRLLGYGRLMVASFQS